MENMDEGINTHSVHTEEGRSIKVKEVQVTGKGDDAKAETPRLLHAEGRLMSVWLKGIQVGRETLVNSCER